MTPQNAVMIATPLGYVQLITEDNQVVALEFEHLVSGTLQEKEVQNKGALSHEQAVATYGDLQLAIDQIQAYFDGTSKGFSFNWSLAKQGTEFQRAVWQVIAEIPYGQVMSYKEIAETIGKPRAYRAVANACGANPLPIVVPCHRVVGSGSNGKYTLGGYSSGLDKKRALMQIEKIEL